MNVSELKQQSGYTRASRGAQALDGAVPVIDLNKKGDLQKLFASKAPTPFADSPSAKAAALSEAALRHNAPTQKQQQPAPIAERPEQKEPAPIASIQAANAHTIKSNDQQPPAPAANTATAIPPQFAPVMTAGALSAVHHEHAAAEPTVKTYTQGDEFKTGRLTDAAGVLRKTLGLTAYSNASDQEHTQKKENQILMQQAAEQQRQQFMRSTEYAVAMQTVDREIRKLEVARDQSHARVKELEVKSADLGEKIETGKAEVQQDEKRLGEHVELRTLNENLQQEEDNLISSYDLLDQIHAKRSEMQQASLKIEGKNIVYTVMEEGKPVKYLVDENGQKQKAGAGKIYVMDQQIFARKQPDGTVGYVDLLGNNVSQKTKDMIDARLQAANVKAEDVMPDYDVYKEEQDKANAHARDAGVDSIGLNYAWNSVEECEAALKDHATKLGFPLEDLPKLNDNIKNMEDALAAKKAQIEKWETEKSKTDTELEKERQAIAKLETQLKQNRDFKENLQNGRFNNTEEMKAAMPKEIKVEYERKLAERKEQEQNLTQNNAPVTATPPAQENTSRANGSAAAAYEADTANNGATISGKFQNAAANTVPEATPETPAPAPTPDDDMEYTAPYQQPKAQAAGMVR